MPGLKSASAPLPSQPSQPSHPKGLCVFDIDATLTRHKYATPQECGGPLPAGPTCRECVGLVPAKKRAAVGPDSFPGMYSQQAVQQCLQKGYAVGLATSRNCSGETLQARLHWMQRMGLPTDITAADGSAGPAVGCAPASAETNKLHKWKSINRLIDHYKVRPEKTVFFDDSASALRAAKAKIPGLNTQLASSNCKGKWCPRACGLSQAEFASGMEKTMSHHHHRHHHQ
eukprot:Sspe_Gene.1488::Locus_489_Transcript_1_1_Confidence_1.000_Length_2063::g.1488::m.1488